MTDKITQHFRFGRAFIKDCPEIDRLEYEVNDNFKYDLKLVNDDDFDELDMNHDAFPLFWGIKRGTCGVMIDVKPYPCPYFDINIYFKE